MLAVASARASTPPTDEKVAFAKQADPEEYLAEQDDGRIRFWMCWKTTWHEGRY